MLEMAEAQLLDARLDLTYYLHVYVDPRAAICSSSLTQEARHHYRLV